MSDNLNQYSKEFIETGKVPVDELLFNSVYYPACGTDGRPVKKLNPLYAKYGINSYVYADYAIGGNLLSERQEEFKNYHVFGTRELKRTDLYTGSMDFSGQESLFTPEETRSYREIISNFSDNLKIFGRWIVYERDPSAGEEIGTERFSLLYIGGEGAATYAALYLSRNIAPCVLAVINPGIAFGGNYSCFRSVFSKVVDSGLALPKYFLSGNAETSATDCILQDYEKGICLQ